MASQGSAGVVVTSVASSALIGFAAFAAASVSGTAAMMAIALEGLAAVLGQTLVLRGLGRARRPPDDRFPFGYTREIYFWSCVLPLLLFALGCGVAVDEGLERLSQSRSLTRPDVIYAVLLIALLMQAGTTVLVARTLRRQQPATPLWAALAAPGRPALFSVLLQNLAGLACLAVALAATLLWNFAGRDAADPVATSAIGAIMGIVAVTLAVRTRAMLIGEAAPKALVTGVCRLLSKYDGKTGPIECINEVRTLQLGPGDVLVAVSVDMTERATAHDVEHLTSRLESALRLRFPEISHFYLEVQSAERHRGFLADRLRGRVGPREFADAGGAPTSAAPLVVEALRAVDEAPGAAPPNGDEPAEPGAHPRAPAPRGRTHPHGSRKRGKTRRR